MQDASWRQPTATQPQKAFPVSWDQFHRDARALAWRLAEAGPFAAIVCITRGGLVPAAIVARELGIRVIETVCVTSYDHVTQGELEVLKKWRADIVAIGGGRGKGVLMVDDLVDTGKTAKIVREILPKRISPPSMPSRWAGRWSIHSSPKCRRTPGFLFPSGYRPRLPAADQGPAGREEKERLVSMTRTATNWLQKDPEFEPIRRRSGGPPSGAFETGLRMYIDKRDLEEGYVAQLLLDLTLSTRMAAYGIGH